MNILAAAAAAIATASAGSGGSSTPPLFRATKSSNQTGLGAETLTQVTFDGTDFDADTAFASNEYTVPASRNGQYGVFNASILSSASLYAHVDIERSTDGGSVWAAVASYVGYGAANAWTVPLLLTTGHKYRVSISLEGTNRDVEATGTTFSAFAVEEADVAFLASLTSNAGSNTTANFGTVVLDPESGASTGGRWTVPAAYNGRTALLLMTGQTGTTNTWVYPRIGSTDIGGQGNRVTGAHTRDVITCAASLVQLATSDVYEIFVAGGNGIVTDTHSQFAMVLLPDTAKEFRADVNATQSISGDTELQWPTEDFDDDNGFASNRYTVPASENGKRGIFGVSISNSGTGPHDLKIQRSSDSGSTWDELAWNGNDQNITTVFAGPVELATGDIIRAVMNPASSKTRENSPRVKFWGCTGW